MFSHLVGYIGSISGDEYTNMKNHGYKQYQKVGKSGLEKQYDKILRGNDGYVRRIVDVHNRTEGEEMGLTPTAGNNVVLTVDYGVQKAAFDAMAENRGSVVVLKPSTARFWP
jgi:penicillin-binding protein 2